MGRLLGLGPGGECWTYALDTADGLYPFNFDKKTKKLSRDMEPGAGDFNLCLEAADGLHDEAGLA